MIAHAGVILLADLAIRQHVVAPVVEDAPVALVGMTRGLLAAVAPQVPLDAELLYAVGCLVAVAAGRWVLGRWRRRLGWLGLRLLLGRLGLGRGSGPIAALPFALSRSPAFAGRIAFTVAIVAGARKFILGFVGMAIGLIIGILIFSAVEESITCPDAVAQPDGSESCERASQIAWTVIGILPITMFFAIFTIFGGLSKFSFEYESFKRAVISGRKF